MVPPSRRIAAFDNDGPAWCEQPLHVLRNDPNAAVRRRLGQSGESGERLARRKERRNGHRTERARHRKSGSDRISVELSSRRTGMSFQRTRMSADRTLMSVIRTSLSLIGFGFTIFQVFQKAHEANLLKSGKAPRHFGEALVWLGLAMLIIGIVYHVMFMLGLRREREMLKADGLIHAESGYPVSFTLIVAIVLLAIGALAISSMVFSVGPFD